MPNLIFSFISISIFAFVHLIAEKTTRIGFHAKSKFLSMGNGVAISYIFIDLLPKLAKNDVLFKNISKDFFPYIEHHAYILSLIGFLLFYSIDRAQGVIFNRSLYYKLSLGSYILFNFLVGYAVADKNNPEVQPLILFTIAMALHYFMNDYSLTEAHGMEYRKYGKRFLILSLFLGWLIGILTQIPEAGVALMSAFIGGGVIMNVTRHELSHANPNNLGIFLFAAFTYTVILLSLAAG